MKPRITNQDFFILDPQIKQEIVENLRGHFSKFTRKARIVFNYLIRYLSRRGKVYVSQARIARECGVSIRQVSRWLIEWHESGLIYSNYRHMMTNQYKASSYLFRSDVRQLLKSIIFSFGIFPCATLLNSYQSMYSENGRQPKINIFIYHRIDIDRSDLDKIQPHARVREGALTTNRAFDTRNNQKERSSMIADYVNDIQSPVLTTKDKEILSRYTKEAVRHGLVQLQRYTNLTNPVSFMIKCAQNYDARSTKPLQKKEPEAPKSPMYTPYQPKEVRDAAYWQKDNEELAHWDMIELGAQFERFRKDVGFDFLIDIYVTKVKKAYTAHVEATCHLCTVHGPTYKLPATFYTVRKDLVTASPLQDIPPAVPATTNAPPPTPSPLAQSLSKNIPQTTIPMTLDEDPWGLEAYDPENTEIVY